jgi:hypothetical protein
MKRFFDKIEKTDYCWNFMSALRGNGYGCIKINKKTISAHRLSWEIHFGKIPDGLFVCHKCDNRRCVNPNHLFLGTQKDNMSDCRDKNRLITPVGIRFVKGIYPKNTKIPEILAIEIKQAIINRGNKKLITIANDFNVPYQYARDISANRILKNR